MQKFCAIFSFVSVLNLTLSAQSDEPCSATVLSVAPTCAAVSIRAVTTSPATLSNSTNTSAGVTLPALSCNGFTATTRDFWYRLAVPASGSVYVTIRAGEGVSPSNSWDMAVYRSSSNTCLGSSFTQIDSDCGVETPPSVTITGETAGSTLYIRVWREAAFLQTAAQTFEIYAADGSIAAPTSCGTYITPASGATGEDKLLFVFDKPAGTFGYDLYIGSTALDAVSVGNYTSNPTQIRESILAPYANFDGTTLTDIVAPNAAHAWYVVPRNCINASPPIGSCQAGAASFTAGNTPTNEDCSGAFQLEPSAVYTSPTVFATQSQAAAACSGSTSGYAADTWFKFTTNGSGGSAVVTAQSYGFSNLVVQAFSGTCGSLTALSCVDEAFEDGLEQLTLTGLAPNTTHYLRVYSYASGNDFLYPDGFDIDVTGTSVAPVELIKFAGEQRGNVNLLRWTTASEKNAQDFVVERSETSEDAQFKAIGTIKAAGNSNVLRDYELIDPNPTPFAYYRLRQRDLDGKEAVSKTILVTRNNKNLGINRVYPTPTSGDLSVQFNTSRTGNVRFELVDILGRVVFQKTAAYTEGEQLEHFSLQNVTPGTYILRLSNGTNATQTRVVKQ